MKGISRRACVGLLSLIFLLALVSACPVEAKTPLRWEAFSYYTFEPEWSGDIYRGDGVHGYLYLDVIEWVDLPNVQHVSGIWWIDWDDGQYIVGDYKGKVVWSTGEGVLNGQVTDTSPDWSYLDGRNVHITSTISPVWTAYTIIQIN